MGRAGLEALAKIDQRIDQRNIKTRPDHLAALKETTGYDFSIFAKALDGTYVTKLSTVRVLDAEIGKTIQAVKAQIDIEQDPRQPKSYMVTYENEYGVESTALFNEDKVFVAYGKIGFPLSEPAEVSADHLPLVIIHFEVMVPVIIDPVIIHTGSSKRPAGSAKKQAKKEVESALISVHVNRILSASVCCKELPGEMIAEQSGGRGKTAYPEDPYMFTVKRSANGVWSTQYADMPAPKTFPKKLNKQLEKARERVERQKWVPFPQVPAPAVGDVLASAERVRSRMADNAELYRQIIAPLRRPDGIAPPNPFDIALGERLAEIRVKIEEAKKGDEVAAAKVLPTILAGLSSSIAVLNNHVSGSKMHIDAELTLTKDTIRRVELNQGDGLRGLSSSLAIQQGVINRSIDDVTAKPVQYRYKNTKITVNREKQNVTMLQHKTGLLPSETTTVLEWLHPTQFNSK